MLGLTVAAVGALTVGVGAVIEAQTAHTDATRVADELAAMDPSALTGRHTHRVSFAAGGIETVDRTLRVLENGSVIERHEIDALVFEHDEARVASIAGAVVRGQPGTAWFVADPTITASERTGALVVGAPVLGAGRVAVGGRGGGAVRLRTNVSHTEHELGAGQYAVAIETETPAVFERYFEQQNASTDRRQFPGDGTDSVVARYHGERHAYVVVHELGLEVHSG